MRRSIRVRGSLVLSVGLVLSLVATSSARAGTGSWSSTGKMAKMRWAATATLLPNGRVLVAGGLHAGKERTSAEIYDPGSGTWSRTGGMRTGRLLHTATLLHDGRVLVAGGEGGNYLASAEIYDPASGTWSITGSMAEPRSYYTATLLHDGRVLVAGGYHGTILARSTTRPPGRGRSLGAWRRPDGSTPRPCCPTAVSWWPRLQLRRGPPGQRRDLRPAAGTWSITGSMATTRYGATATSLLDGRVLAVGGTNDRHAEVYDPASGTWSPSGRTRVARDRHTTTLLLNGRVLVAGGAISDTETTAEIYTPG